jgi:hypothetical protein
MGNRYLISRPFAIKAARGQDAPINGAGVLGKKD